MAATVLKRATPPSPTETISSSPESTPGLSGDETATPLSPQQPFAGPQSIDGGEGTAAKEKVTEIILRPQELVDELSNPLAFSPMGDAAAFGLAKGFAPGLGRGLPFGIPLPGSPLPVPGVAPMRGSAAPAANPSTTTPSVPICRYNLTGNCRFGDNCRHLHTTQEAVPSAVPPAAAAFPLVPSPMFEFSTQLLAPQPSLPLPVPISPLAAVLQGAAPALPVAATSTTPSSGQSNPYAGYRLRRTYPPGTQPPAPSAQPAQAPQQSTRGVQGAATAAAFPSTVGVYPPSSLMPLHPASFAPTASTPSATSAQNRYKGSRITLPDDYCETIQSAVCTTESDAAPTKAMKGHNPYAW